MAWPQDSLLKRQRKSALKNNPLPGLLFTWLQCLPLLGCGLSVQQHAKQPTLCSCQGTRLPTTENSQESTGAVAKHKGNLVSKGNSMLLECASYFLLHQLLYSWTSSSWYRRHFLTGMHTPGQVCLGEQWPLWSSCCFRWCSWSEFLCWFKQLGYSYSSYTYQLFQDLLVCWKLLFL